VTRNQQKAQEKDKRGLSWCERESKEKNNNKQLEKKFPHI
jgi:hypothetical protein